MTKSGHGNDVLKTDCSFCHKPKSIEERIRTLQDLDYYHCDEERKFYADFEKEWELRAEDMAKAVIEIREAVKKENGPRQLTF